MVRDSRRKPVCDWGENQRFLLICSGALRVQLWCMNSCGTIHTGLDVTTCDHKSLILAPSPKQLADGRLWFPTVHYPKFLCSSWVGLLPVPCAPSHLPGHCTPLIPPAAALCAEQLLILALHFPRASESWTFISLILPVIKQSVQSQQRAGVVTNIVEDFNNKGKACSLESFFLFFFLDSVP